MAYSWMIICLAAGSISAPAEEPLKVDLPVFDEPDADADMLTSPLEPENYGQPLNQNNLKGQTSKTLVLSVQSLPTGSVNEQKGHGWLSNPVSTLEGALLETEGIGSKVLSTKDNLHNFAAGIFQPKPIVDTIEEKDKYGNTGDKFYTAGKALVGGAENVSNFVNSVLEVPGTIFRKITRIATEKLNNLGGKLIGL